MSPWWELWLYNLHSLLPLSLCMSLPVDGVSQPLKPTGRWLESSNAQGFFWGGSGVPTTSALCFFDVFALVETSFLTATLCLIWKDSCVEAVTVEKSCCLCNTSVLSDEINSTVKVSCWQSADRQEKIRSICANFETLWRTLEMNPLTPFTATAHWKRTGTIQTTCMSNLPNQLSVFLCDTMSFVTRLMWGQILITAQ